MRELTYRDAIREALRGEMRRDERVFIMGEDVANYGGSFRVTHGLLAEFGTERIFDTPLSESAIIGAAVGASLMGMRPVAEVMFADFTTVAMDAIVNHAAKWTGRLVIVHEAPVRGGFGGEVAAVVANKAFGYLDAPIQRVGAPWTPVPFGPVLVEAYVPNEGDIIRAVHAALGAAVV